MIDFNYKLVQEYTIKRLFIPYILFLFTYVIYFNKVNIDYTHFLKHPIEFEYHNLLKYSEGIMKGLLIAFALYFLTNEVK